MTTRPLRNRFLRAGLLLTATVLFAACKKDKTDVIADDGDTGYAAEHYSLESASNEGQTLLDVAVANNNSVSGYLRTTGGTPTPLSACATVTHDTTTHVLTLDFGPTNCLCGDGVYRRGKILCTYTGRYKDMASVHTITYQNFYRNDNQLTGSKTVTNMGANSAGQVYYTVVDSLALSLANGTGTRSWVSTRTRTWTAGYSTAIWSDDAYSITGTGTVTRVNGHTFAVAVTAPLQIAAGCNWIKAGTLTITPQTAAVRTLDYGNGTCDDSATLSVNGTSRIVTLR